MKRNQHIDAHGLSIQQRINQALTETLTDIGQIDKPTKAALNRLVKQGLLSKGKGGPFPALKTVYAVSGFDFETDREFHIAEAMRLSEMDRRARELRAAIQRSLAQEVDASAAVSEVLAKAPSEGWADNSDAIRDLQTEHGFDLVRVLLSRVAIFEQHGDYIFWKAKQTTA